MPSAAESSLLFAVSLCGVSSGVIPAHWRRLATENLATPEGVETKIHAAT